MRGVCFPTKYQICYFSCITEISLLFLLTLDSLPPIVTHSYNVYLGNLKVKYKRKGIALAGTILLYHPKLSHKAFKKTTLNTQSFTELKTLWLTQEACKQYFKTTDLLCSQHHISKGIWPLNIKAPFNNYDQRSTNFGFSFSH